MVVGVLAGVFLVSSGWGGGAGVWCLVFGSGRARFWVGGWTGRPPAAAAEKGCPRRGGRWVVGGVANGGRGRRGW